MKINISLVKTRYKLGVLLLMAMLMMSMNMASSLSMDSTIASETQINELMSTNPDIKLDDKLDGYLKEMVKTNKVLDGANYIDGKLSIQMIVMNDPTIGGKIDPITVSKLDENVFYVHATVDDLAEIELLEAEDSVFKIGTDRYYGPELSSSTDFNDEIGFDDIINEEVKTDQFIVMPHSVETREVLGINDLNPLGYNGSGININIHDTGVDFGHTMLRNAMAVDENGYPLSFEPMGRMSLTSLWSLDYWVGMYADDPNMVAMLEGWFSPRHADADGNISIAHYNNLKCFAADLGSVYSLGQFGISLPENYTVGNLPGNETGFAFGVAVTHNNGYIQFVPFLEADADDDGVYDTLYVDYQTGWALTMWWWTEEDSYLDYATYDFSDAVATTNNANLALSADIWNGTTVGVPDGYYDISMGSIANVYDMNDFVDDDILLGIPADGKALGHIWDVGGHGTGCAGYAVGAWTDYQLLSDPEEWEYPNNETYTIGGMAPEANLIATAGFSDTATNLGWQWACGFDYNATSGYWEFNPDSTHIAKLSSNSWGVSAVMDGNEIAMGWDFTTMFIDYLSAPGYIDPAYPGMLFLTSTGNGGSGMGTSKQPSQSTAAVAVGASTVNWWRYTTGYGDNETQQGNDQVIGWSDNGPAVTGYPKIDILAPGAFDFSIQPVEIGGTTFTEVFGGTSASCPVAAGGMAVLYQAWEMVHPGEPLTPDMAKVILKSTAKDLGYDPYMQGTGRIDVQGMVDYVNSMGDRLIGYSYDAPAMTVDRSFYNFAYIWFGVAPPLAVQPIADNAIFGGSLFAGENVTNDLHIMGNASALDYEAIKFETVYSATNSSVELKTSEYYTPFAIADLFDIAQLQNADYFQLTLAMSLDDANDYRADFERNPPYMYVTSLESGTVGSGDEEWGFWNYGYDNDNFQDLFLPTNFLADNDVYIRVRDYVFDENGTYYNENWTGMDFTLSVRAFKRVVDPQITLADEGSGNFTVTIDVDPLAVPGLYEGYIIINSTDTNQLLIPYGYSVAGFVEEYNVDGWTYLSDGTLTGRPNDNGLYGCADWNWRAETGDWRYYDFVVDNSSAMNTIALELEWVNPGSEMNMWLVDNDGWVIDYTDYMTNAGQYISNINAPDTMQRLLIDLPWATDLYTVIVHSTTLNPTVDTVPLENFTLKVTYLNETVDDFTEPELTVSAPEVVGDTYYSDSQIGVTWSNVSVNPIPEFVNNLYPTSVSLAEATMFSEEYTIPEEDIVLNTGAIVPEWTKDFYIEAGQYVVGDLDWDDGAIDYDYLLMPYGLPYDFDNDIFNAAGGSSAKPEHFEGVVTTSGWYTLVVEYYGGPGLESTVDISFNIMGDTVYESVAGIVGVESIYDFSANGALEGSYLLTTSAFGWNYDRTYSLKVFYSESDPVVSGIVRPDEYPAESLFDISYNVLGNASGFVNISVDDVVVKTELYQGALSNDLISSISIDAVGDHNITIYAEDYLGHHTSQTVNITIIEDLLPNAAFTPTAVDLYTRESVYVAFLNENVTFTTTASGNGPSIYEWTVGENTFDTEILVYNFTTTGVYEVSVVIEDMDGDTSSHAMSIVVEADVQPDATFTASASTINASDSITFTESSGGNLPLTRAWDFGDGETLNAGVTSVTHTFVTAGEYTVTLTITDLNGDESTYTMDITVNEVTPEPKPGIPGFGMASLSLVSIAVIAIIIKKKRS
ncbi:MAG: S8 family serine peptidase [Promethearchaeota archaeon]